MCVCVCVCVCGGCGTWCVTWTEEHRLRVSEHRVQGTFGHRDEVTWEWRKLHNEALNDLYCSSNVSRVNKSRRDWRDM